MPTDIPTDAEAFLLFLVDEVKNGGADKSPEELLQMWRTTHADVISDIRQGLTWKRAASVPSKKLMPRFGESSASHQSG